VNVALAVLADYASVDSLNKMTLVGIFGVWNPPSLPFNVPIMYVAARFGFEPAETNSTKKIRISLHDLGGRELLNVGPMDLQVSSSGTTTQNVEANVMVRINDLVINKAGMHKWQLLVDNDLKAIITMMVNPPEI